MKDFNSVRNVHEKSDMENFDMSAMAEFNAHLGNVDIEDLTAKGNWSSRGGDIGGRKSRIDRAMVSHKWQDCFPGSLFCS